MKQINALLTLVFVVGVAIGGYWLGSDSTKKYYEQHPIIREVEVPVDSNLMYLEEQVKSVLDPAALLAKDPMPHDVTNQFRQCSTGNGGSLVHSIGYATSEPAHFTATLSYYDPEKDSFEWLTEYDIDPNNGDLNNDRPSNGWQDPLFELYEPDTAITYVQLHQQFWLISQDQNWAIIDTSKDTLAEQVIVSGDNFSGQPSQTSVFSGYNPDTDVLLVGVNQGMFGPNVGIFSVFIQTHQIKELLGPCTNWPPAVSLHG